MSPSQVDFATGAPVAGTLDVVWIHGVRSRRQPPDPPMQVHRYDEHTVILRQSKSLNYEAPFLFLLFGNNRALLLDTGATADPALFPLRATVDGLIEAWLAEHPREEYQLVVTHTHGHADHVAADAQFADRPDTVVVSREAEAVRAFFGFGDGWPTRTVTLDLGGRVLEILGSPGHHEAAVTMYDPWTGLLLTGDTVLPGRLYVSDVDAFRASMDRMVNFAGRRPVTHVVGCHIEMTNRPGRDYPLGATYQPAEHALALSTVHLGQIRDAAANARPGVHRYADFILYQDPPKSDVLRLLIRARINKLRHTIARRLTR